MNSRLRFYYHQIKANKSSKNSIQQLKYFFKWKKSLEPHCSSVKDEQPWTTFEFIDFCKKKLNKQSRVFEYGGGGSSLFFIKRVKELITIEHDKEWFDVLSSIIAKRNYSNWKGMYIQPEKGDLLDNPDIADPDHYSSDDKYSSGFNFFNYASSIDNFDDNYFDLVLIDGRSRPSCIKHSMPKIKKGGYLVLDNSDRHYYLSLSKKIMEPDFIIKIDNFGATPYSDVFTKTSVWQKK
jgi:hypothetical protein